MEYEDCIGVCFNNSDCASGGYDGCVEGQTTWLGAGYCDDGTWGMYLDPNYHNSGLGVLLETYIIERIFKHHKLRKIWGEALSSNHNMLNIHKKFGFIVEGILKKHIK